MGLGRDPGCNGRGPAPFAPTVRLLLVLGKSLLRPLVHTNRCDGELHPLVRMSNAEREIAVVPPARLRRPVRALTGLVNEPGTEGMDKIVGSKGNAKDTPLRHHRGGLWVAATGGHGLIDGMLNRIGKRDPPFRRSE